MGDVKSREPMPSATVADGAAEAWRSGMLTLLGTVLLVGGAIVMSVVFAQAAAESWVRIALVVSFAPVALTLLGRRHLGIRVRASAFVLSALSIECITALTFGPTMAVPITLMISSFVATLVLGRTAGLVAVLLGAALFLAFGILNRDALGPRFAADLARPATYLRMAMTMTTGAVVIVLALAHALKRLETGLEEARAALAAARQQQVERERAEVELRESEEKLRLVLEGAAIAPWTIDLQTHRVTWGANAGRALGFPDDGLPRTMNEVKAMVRPEQWAVVEARLRSTPDGPRPPIELHLRLPSGQEAWVESRSLRTMGPHGPVSMGTLVNITDRRRAAEALRAREAALESSRLKSAFVANISHEIRTPMNAVSGLTYLLAQTALSEKQRGYVDRIQSATRALLEVINDVLDMSKIEAGRLVIEANPFRLDDVLARVCDLLSARAEEKGIAMSFSTAPDVPQTVVGDPMRTGQVLLNLVGNAVKFTESGSVATTVEVVPGDAGRVSLRFAVRDTGIGLRAERLTDIFEPFTQADGSTTRRFGGTGLGLTISKSIVEAMGGAIAVSSAVGEGSTFAFTVPFGVATATDQAAVTQRASGTQRSAVPSPVLRHPADDGRLDGLCVLLVDDAPINQEVAREILESAGARVVVAENGLAAVQTFTERQGAFDAVLMDVQMPIMDGYEATRTLRRSALGKDVPIIAMTAHAFDSERQRCADAGMVDYVPKPFDPHSLIAAIRAWQPS